MSIIMKKLIFTLFIISLFTVFAKDKNDYYSKPTHFIFENYIGDWNVIYASYAEKSPPNGGRGTSQSTIEMGGTILKFDNKLAFSLGEIQTRYIIGWDKHNAKYYFLSYDNSGETPYTVWGNYYGETKIFEFKSNWGDQKDGDFRVEMKFERADKLIINSYIVRNGKEEKQLETAFIKK